MNLQSAFGSILKIVFIHSVKYYPFILTTGCFKSEKTGTECPR